MARDTFWRVFGRGEMGCFITKHALGAFSVVICFGAICRRTVGADGLEGVLSIEKRTFKEVFSKRDSSSEVLKIFNVKKASQKL